MKNLAIITARSGSKGLPNKNILPLNGKPLIAHTIEAALQSGLFDQVYVSTDSEEYAQISEQFGALAHPLRPEALSGDRVGSMEVLLDVLERFPGYDTFCLLQPTSPFRDAKDIKTAYEIYEDKQASSVVSMVKSDKSPQIINQFNENGTITDFLKLDQKTYARQNEHYYLPNGAIFISDVAQFLKAQDFYGTASYPYVMSKKKSIDIDDIYDYELAKVISQAHIQETEGGEQ